jgi:hypothetical protein
LKLGQFHLTEADCDAALKLEPQNAKVRVARLRAPPTRNTYPPP